MANNRKMLMLSALNDQRRQERGEGERYAETSRNDKSDRSGTRNYDIAIYPGQSGMPMQPSMTYGYPDTTTYLGDPDMVEPPAMRQGRDSRGRYTSGGNSTRMQIGFRAPEELPDKRYPEMPYTGGMTRKQSMQRGYAVANEAPMLDEQMCEEWMAGLHNEDGSKGPHWTKEQAKQVMASKGFAGDPCEFWCALNAVYADYVRVAKKMGVNSLDFYAEMANAFIHDKDAEDDKMARYYEYIVKK